MIYVGHSRKQFTTTGFNPVEVLMFKLNAMNYSVSTKNWQDCEVVWGCKSVSKLPATFSEFWRMLMYSHTIPTSAS